MAVLATLRSAHIAVLYVLAFLIGTEETLPRAVGQPLIRATVDDHLLERANGRLFASQATALQFVGPPLDGVLFAVAVPAPFWVNAGTFAVAAVLVMRMRTRPEPPRERVRVVEGLRWLLNHRSLRAMTAVSATGNLCIAMTMATLVLFAEQRLGLTNAGFGLFLAVVAHDLVTTAVFAVVSSFCTAVWGVATAVARQREVPRRLLGRVSSAQTLITWGVQPVGALLGGVVAGHFGLLAPWFVAVGLRTAVGLLCLKPVRGYFAGAALGVRSATGDAAGAGGLERRPSTGRTAL